MASAGPLRMGSARTAPKRAAPVRPTKVRRRTEGSSSSLSPASALSRPETAGGGKAGRVSRGGITGGVGAAAGLVRMWACDPKLMELAFGRALFDRYGRYACDPADIAGLLEEAVADMQARARRFAGRQRDHTSSAEFPFTVIMVDEIAFLTAYQADRKLRERTLAALATLTTQGRAVGYSVVAALQDPRKEVLNIRNLFPDKIALRLDEPSQVDMVLGDGARDRGARCDDISSNPDVGAGVGFVRLEADPDPVRDPPAHGSPPDHT